MSGKPVILITGASSGIGAATAKRFGANGYVVVLAARRMERLQALADEIKAAGGEALPVDTDLMKLDEINTLVNSVDRVFFFSDLRGLDGEIVTHRWEYAGEVKAEVTFKVGNGARWRVYSSKNLLPDWTGTWTVVVSTQAGEALQTSTFEYTAK